MIELLLIGLGGFIGAVLRYLIGGWVQSSFPEFPMGTLTVNVLGSYMISVIMFGVEEKNLFTPYWRIFLAIGIMGSFTTMSSFNYETFKLLQNNQYLYAGLNILANVFLGLLAIYLGRVTILAVK